MKVKRDHGGFGGAFLPVDPVVGKKQVSRPDGLVVVHRGMLSLGAVAS